MCTAFNLHYVLFKDEKDWEIISVITVYHTNIVKIC